MFPQQNMLQSRLQAEWTPLSNMHNADIYVYKRYHVPHPDILGLFMVFFRMKFLFF